MVHLRCLRSYGGHPSRIGDVSSRVVDNLRLLESEGWLAIRSSLTNAGERRMVGQTGASWNRIADWLRYIDALQQAA